LIKKKVNKGVCKKFLSITHHSKKLYGFISI